MEGKEKRIVVDTNVLMSSLINPESIVWKVLDIEDITFLLPEIAEGKYLKLVHKMHEDNGTLVLTEEELDELCGDCDLGEKCPEDSGLSLYCLEGIFTKV